MRKQTNQPTKKRHEPPLRKVPQMKHHKKKKLKTTTTSKNDVPMQRSSEIHATFDAGDTSMQSFPTLTTGHERLHSCRHFLGRQRSLLTMAMRSRRSPESSDEDAPPLPPPFLPIAFSSKQQKMKIQCPRRERNKTRRRQRGGKSSGIWEPKYASRDQRGIPESWKLFGIWIARSGV